MKTILIFLLATSMLAGCGERVTSTGASSNDRLNVLFIIADDLRNDLGVYGDKLAVAPHLDALAATSLVFNRAYCQKAVCWPSRNSFFSGLMPGSLGKNTDAFNTFRTDHPDIVSLPQLFKQHGWNTYGFGKILHNGQDDPVSWSEPLFEPRPCTTPHRRIWGITPSSTNPFQRTGPTPSLNRPKSQTKPTRMA